MQIVIFSSLFLWRIILVNYLEKFSPYFHTPSFIVYILLSSDNIHLNVLYILIMALVLVTLKYLLSWMYN